MKAFVKITLGFLLAIFGALLVSIVISNSCSALSSIEAGANSAYGEGQATELFGSNGIFTKIISTLLFLVGVMSVIMLIVGGMRYVISSGNAHSVNDAKNTILYAIVGIVASLIAYAVINFVLSSLLASDSGNY